VHSESKTGQSNLTQSRIAAAHGRSNRIRQVALMCTPSNTWLLGPTRVHIPNGISIGSAVFAGITTVTDRPSDTPRYSVCNNRSHLRSTAMRPKTLPTTKKYCGLRVNCRVSLIRSESHTRSAGCHSGDGGSRHDTIRYDTLCLCSELKLDVCCLSCCGGDIW